MILTVGKKCGRLRCKPGHFVFTCGVDDRYKFARRFKPLPGMEGHSGLSLKEPNVIAKQTL